MTDNNILTNPHAILDDMALIVARDRMKRGVYVSETYDLSMEGEMCEGRLFCAVGSLYWAAGVREFEDPGLIEGVESRKRDQYMADKPALRQAYDALNDAAVQWAEQRGWNLDDEGVWDTNQFYHSALERMFEGTVNDTDYPRNLTNRDLLHIISDAHDLIPVEAT